MAVTVICSNLPFQRNQPLLPQVSNSWNLKIACSVGVHGSRKGLYRSLLYSCSREIRHLPRPISAVGSGLEATITEQKKDDITLDNVKILVESRDDDQITVRVDVPGEETQKAFDDVLLNLARTAPPVPGFRKMKGGKTSNVPKSLVLQALGRDRVTKFVIQEIVSITTRDYVEKEKLTVENQFKTIQTEEELASAFTPGSDFGFNATMDIVKADSEAAEVSKEIDSDSP